MGKRAVMPVLAILCGVAAYATPSTLIWIPSTDIQAAGTSHFGGDVYAPSDGDALSDYGLTFGSPSGRFEYGIDYLKIEGASMDDPVRLNAKMLVRDETEGAPTVVIGAYDLGGTAASNMVYVLGSKSFAPARVTFGSAVGRESVLGDDNNMLLLGIDRAFGSKWWCAIDYQSGKSAFGALSAGIAYNFTPASSVILGYDWYNDSALEDTLTIQYDLSL